ncbi:50S ribosomal protein L4, chloroplastic [Glycine max]|nr:50S ribosomal protein L4, chloroplastic [Glycine max]
MASLSLSLSTPTTATSLSFTSSCIFFSSHQFHTHNNSPRHNKKMSSNKRRDIDLQNKHRGTASTLTRSEVRGGDRKPFPQKKNRPRLPRLQPHSLRPGGGVIFGPKPRDWSIKINRKEKRLAISTAIASAAASAVVVEDFVAEFAEKPKTKEFIASMKLL